MRRIAQAIQLLATAAACSGCVTWSRDVVGLANINTSTVIVQVPQAWHHDAAKLELCIELDGKYERDVARRIYIDPETGPLKISLVGIGERGRQPVPGGTFYIGRNLTCYAMARDNVTYYTAIEITGSQVIKVSKAYWYWGHYI